MPRENRKRGKKHRKSSTSDNVDPTTSAHDIASSQVAGPSWITRVPAKPVEDDGEAPFGYLDSDIKAYFRTVDLQIREWQEDKSLAMAESDTDPNEDRRTFFLAALNEMSGNEKQLSTDPDCSGVLERMLYSMDDFARRVFADRLSGSYERLLRHRFASHVCQTLLTTAEETVSRESHGVYPASESEECEELRTMSQLVVDICEEIMPALSSLILDPFASHVIRALLLLLSPELTLHLPGKIQGHSTIRSKKSSVYKAKQGSLTSVFTSSEPAGMSVGLRSRPADFKLLVKSFVTNLRRYLDGNEIRALAANQVASPVLQLLLEIEASQCMANEPGSLMDNVLAGLITTLHEDQDAIPEASDYVGTLLRDPTSSHLLETIVFRSPDRAYNVIWQTYFRGKLSRLAVHPVANFVVAKVLLRMDPRQLEEACGELGAVGMKIVKASRVGVLRALVERAAALHHQESAVIETICAAFEIHTSEDRLHLLPCVLRLLPLPDYRVARSKDEHQEPLHTDQESKAQIKSDGPLEPKTQGALLLQSLLSMAAPHNQIVIDSLFSHNLEEMVSMSYNATSSRVLDALLDSPVVPLKAKRQFVLKFIGNFHTLVDHKIGSRVGDRCWDSADPYLKEKIARSLIPYEQFLAGSFYGKFFARRLNLQLLRKDTEKWKSLQSTGKPLFNDSPASTQATEPLAIEQTTAVTKSKGKRKRIDHSEDEIDQLFKTTLGGTPKRAQLFVESSAQKASPHVGNTDQHVTSERGGDRALDDIMDAIKTAPRSEARSGRKKRVK